MKSIATALAAAQANMGKASKKGSNEHFKSKYAELGSVMDACLPALNERGIAVIQPTGENELGRFVETILIHGESGEQLSCRVPLIVNKNDMQGYGSAVTYARRYGLMAMAGIAPEDDDGNAAVKAAPKPAQTVSPEQFIKLRDTVEEWGGDAAKFLASFKAQSLEQFPADKLDNAISRLNAKISETRAETARLATFDKDTHSELEDEIPY
jgi:hypothetical protein